MKKIAAAILSAVLVLSPIGNIVFQDHATAEAKGYKSGKRNFNTTNRNTNNIQKKQEEKKQNEQKQDQNTAVNKNTKPTSGGFMKGLFVGGLAGLLFGSLFANMGMLGSILGFLINILAIVLVIGLVRKLFAVFKEKKEREEEARRWNN